ncbi:MAG: alpha-2-macroglobulin family protein, partial [candidate division WOR-3 bacterium]|nr:alpha-2-macroglobulin family protein [candidate division WOR-3 bacterium]
YKNRANSVAMFTNAGDVIGERNYSEKGENRGGGGADERFRAEFLSLVHYNGILETDENGRAAAAIKLPDNLTTFRIMAVAGNKEKFGSSEHDITVSKTLMITPNMPSFVRPGDSFKAGFIAVNNAEQPLSIDVEAQTEHIEINKGNNDIILPAMNREPIYFTFNADDVMNDSCRFRFSVSGGTYEDKLLLAIPFRNPPVTHVNALCGTTDSVEVHYVKKPSDYLENSLKLDIGMSSTGMNDLKEATAYLFHYPYGCLEQRTSCILPYVLLKREIISSFELTEISSSSINNMVNTYLKNLYMYQKADGGFGIWTDSKYSNPYLSCYVCLVMHYAEDAGYKLDNSVTEKALGYMEDLINGRAGRTFYWNHYSESTKRTIKIMAMAVMSQFGKNTDNYVSQYKQYIETMNTEQLLYYTMSLKKNKYADELKRINERLKGMLTVESRTVHFGETEGDKWIYFDSVKNTAAGLMALLRINGKETPYAYQIITWMLRERKENKWRTTQSNAYALMAITEYFNTYESEEPDFTAKLLIDGIESMNRQFRGYDSNIYNYSIDESAIENDEAKISFVKEGSGLLYYQMMLSFVPTGKTNAEDYGFSVKKEIIPVNENIKGIVKGEKYWVVLKINTPKDRLYVAVDDPLPAGFEIINAAFKTNENIKTGNAYNWYYGFNHKEIYYDRFLLFADYLTKGNHEYRYLVKAKFTGDFHMPQTKVSEMYTPEVFGTTSGDIIEIR